MIYTIEDKVKELEGVNFSWFQIAQILDLDYEKVREISNKLNDN